MLEFKLIYNTYVLKYCILAWSPNLVVGILEQVQHRTTRMIVGFKNLSYEERLKRLEMLPLQRVAGK